MKTCRWRYSFMDGTQRMVEMAARQPPKENKSGCRCHPMNWNRACQSPVPVATAHIQAAAVVPRTGVAHAEVLSAHVGVAAAHGVYSPTIGPWLPQQRRATATCR